MLNHAILSQFFEVAEKLMESEKIDVDKKGIKGSLPIIETIVSKNNVVFLQILKKTKNINVQDEDGWSPLHYAYAFNQPTMVVALLSKGSNPELKNKLGYKPSEVQGILNGNSGNY
jgi:ankyrin repeat protein